MQTVDTYGTFDDILGESGPEAQAIARRLRTLIIELDPDVVEVPWPSQRVVGYGIGPKKMTEHYCYIAAHRSHVNLGFKHGAVLPDPEGVLRGPGDRMKHVRVSSVEEVEHPALRALLAAARAERLAATAA